MRKLSIGILSIIFVVLPFHPFLATWLNSLFFDPLTAPNIFLATWKEALITIFALIFALRVIKGEIRLKIDGLDALIIIFCAWSLLAGFLWTDHGFLQIVIGAKYALLFLVFFFLVRHTPLTDREKDTLFSLALGSATIVILFAVLQKALPEDFLVNFGYSQKHSFGTPAESLAYCQKISHTDLCRVQSTLSGPNQLGAYLGFILPLLFFRGQNFKKGLARTAHLFIFVLGLFVLFWTYSRAAWLGVFAAFLIALALLGKKNAGFRRLTEIGGFLSIFLVALAALLVESETLGGTGFHETIFNLFHSRLFYLAIFAVFALIIGIGSWQKTVFPVFFAAIFNFAVFAIFIMSRFAGTWFWQTILRPSSTQGHFERTADGIKYLAENPWGLGLGDAGPASNRFAENFLGFIPENAFLQVGLESGFLGLTLFVLIFIILGAKLFAEEDKTKIALGIGLIALAVHGLFLHTWESAVVALSFWGLCGVALAAKENVSFWQKLQNYWHNFFVFLKNLFRR